jgi:TonB family protein
MPLAVLIVCLGMPVIAQTQWKPAIFRSGMLPPTPVEAVAGGEVFVQATVTRPGRVGEVVLLRITSPFTQPAVAAIRGWLFQPAEETRPKTLADPRSIVTEAVESKVFVGCVFRPPTLNTPTVGEPPKNVGIATDDVVFPLSTVTPLYPPLAHVDGTVLVRVTVSENGSVLSAATLRSVAGLDEAALNAARRWTFRPARIHGRFQETFAYLVFAFRQPVTSPSSARLASPPSTAPGR